MVKKRMYGKVILLKSHTLLVISLCTKLQTMFMSLHFMLF